MRTSAPLVLAIVTATAAAPACSDERGNKADERTNVLEPGGDAGSTGPGAGGAPAATNCDVGPCEGFLMAGLAYPPCCLPRSEACGVRVGGRCVERSAFTPLDAGSSGGFSIGSAETVVLDPTCPGLTSVMGMDVDLPGCCDVTGVCGNSTAALEAATGFPIPAMCVTAADPIGPFFASGGSGETPCNYPVDAGTGPPDGG